MRYEGRAITVGGTRDVCHGFDGVQMELLEAADTGTTLEAGLIPVEGKSLDVSVDGRCMLTVGLRGTTLVEGKSLDVSVDGRRTLNA